MLRNIWSICSRVRPTISAAIAIALLPWRHWQATVAPWSTQVGAAPRPSRSYLATWYAAPGVGSQRRAVRSQVPAAGRMVPSLHRERERAEPGTSVPLAHARGAEAGRADPGDRTID